MKTQLRKVIALAGLALLGGAAAEARAQPNMIVVRVETNAAGQAVAAEALPVTVDSQVVDADTAMLANAAADEACEQLKDEAEARYRRAARRPNRADIELVRRHACQTVDDRGFDWRLNRYVGGYQVYGSGPRGRYGASLSDYYSGGVQYPNRNVPVYGVTYNGWGGPFSPSGYVYSWNRYNYYYYYDPAFRW